MQTSHPVGRLTTASGATGQTTGAAPGHRLGRATENKSENGRRLSGVWSCGGVVSESYIFFNFVTLYLITKKEGKDYKFCYF